MSGTHVILPSWSPLSADMQAETGARYPAFITLGGTPLFHHIIAEYQRWLPVARYVLIVADDAPAPPVPPQWADALRVVRMSKSDNLARTVNAAMSTVSGSDPVIVHMADTLVLNAVAPELDVVYTQVRDDLYRWTTVREIERGIAVVQDRAQATSAPQSACVGVFTFADGRVFGDALNAALSGLQSHAEPFFTALERYSLTRPLRLLAADEWLDCGHVDTYHKSKLHFQGLRHFNNLVYDPIKGQVTKTSIETERFRHQVRWFKQAPDGVQAYLPRIYASSDGVDPFITMELLSIPTLAELFVTERLALGAWNGVTRMIKHVLSVFGEQQITTSLAPAVARNIYIEKTRARLVRFLEQQPQASEHWVLVQNERWDVAKVQESLDTFGEANGLLTTSTLTPIHGDFCFGNLLFDARANLVKMIDPRGEFGVPGIFGDPRYDLAKLAHSYAGGYDLILAGRFRLDQTLDGRLDCAIEQSPYRRRVQTLFDTQLLPDTELRHQIEALQALLFLSMLPLHADHATRQRALFATGLRMYANAFTRVTVQQ